MAQILEKEVASHGKGRDCSRHRFQACREGACALQAAAWPAGRGRLWSSRDLHRPPRRRRRTLYWICFCAFSARAPRIGNSRNRNCRCRPPHAQIRFINSTAPPPVRVIGKFEVGAAVKKGVGSTDFLANKSEHKKQALFGVKTAESSVHTHIGELTQSTPEPPALGIRSPCVHP